jgi:pimeloyl-ACP methyl ester carboxylesterase
MPADATLAPLDADHQVAYLDGGDPDGVPVIGLHGTPGCRLSRWPDDAVYAAAGVRYVTTDRPGYGWTTRRRGRSVAAEALSVLAVAEHLGLDRFAVAGEGAGAAHALACAALLPDRVTRVACRAPLAPVGPGGMQRRDWATDLPGGDAELRWVADGEIRVLRERQELQTRQDSVTPGPDVDPRVAERFRLVVREQSLQGVAGAVDDTFALARPWGFNLSSIAVPVLLTHRAEDDVPVTHARWLAARIRGAELRIGDGTVEPEDEIAETMAWLSR